jgi:NADH dehydrogenase (ubiquinone) 1 alpha subcomplex subunit 2
MAWKSSLSKAMQELRIHFCQTSAASKGARDFVISSYAELKKANPDFPILVRECSGTEAKLTARYDFNVEHSVSVQGLDASAVAGKVQELIKAGESLPKSGE